jgi:cyclase
MLKNRIIPTLLWKDFGLVKGIGFDSSRRVGSVEQAIRIFNSRDVDELILFDVTATEQHREPRYKEILKFSEWTMVPFSIGGGIHSIKHAEKLFESGADKVIINTAAYDDPLFIPHLSKVFGSQSVIVSIDYRILEGIPICFKNNGLVNTGIKLESWLKRIGQMGAGEIMITNCEKDGTRCGYDLPTIISASSLTDIPLIANGGAGSIEHIKDVFFSTSLKAVGVGSLFQFTEVTPNQIRDDLRTVGIPVRSTFRHPIQD